MSLQDDHSLDEFFPEEDYSRMRRTVETPRPCAIESPKPVFYTPEMVQVNLPYKPVAEPAWDKHRPTQQSKAARFEKLTRWGERSQAVQKVVAWGLVAAGAASLAGPAILTHLPH